MIQATKNKAKSCSLLDAIRRCSFGRSADLSKSRRQGKPCQYALNWLVRYGALCRSKLLSPSLQVSLVPPRIVEKATKNEICAIGKYSLSLSLSLSPHEHTREKNHVRSTQLIQAKFAKPQFQVYSFFSGLCVQNVEVEVRVGTRTAPVLQLWDRERSSKFQR